MSNIGGWAEGCRQLIRRFFLMPILYHGSNLFSGKQRESIVVGPVHELRALGSRSVATGSRFQTRTDWKRRDISAAVCLSMVARV